MRNPFEGALSTYITTVAECGSVRKAAQKLGVSHQTIYHILRKFQQELGIDDLFIESNEIEGLKPNPIYSTIFTGCQAIHSLAQGMQDLVTKNEHIKAFTLSSTCSLFQAFFIPNYGEWLDDKNNEPIYFVEDNKIINNHPRFNEVSMVAQKLDDEKEYKYLHWYDFTQYLHASPKYIKEHGPFNKIEDLTGCYFLFQKLGASSQYSESTSDIRLSHRGILQKIQAKNIGMKILRADGVNTIDNLCVNGFGVMPASQEPILLCNTPIVPILSDKLTGEVIPIYVKIHKQTLLRNKKAEKLISYIFSSLEKGLKKIADKKTATSPGNDFKA